MRILFITDPGIIGGATRSLVEVVTALRDSFGIDCIVCTSSYNELNVELNDVGIENLSCGHRAVMDVRPTLGRLNLIKAYLRFWVDYKMSLRPAIKKIQSTIDLRSVDIIHTNSSRNDIGCILSYKYSIPHIMHIREFGQEDFDCWTYRYHYTSYLNRYTHAFIAISEAVKKSWIKKGLQENKVHVIYNGVNSKSIKPANQIEMAYSKVLKLVAVGGVFPTKGQYQIVEAIGKLPVEIKNSVTLDIIGWSSEEYINKLKQRIEELKLTQQISFLGARSDVYQLLQNYHVGLTCSKSEGFGRVTAEYMHAGLGVIASDTGANPELIIHGETGLLYPFDSISALANQIVTYYQDREFLLSCANEGYRFAVQNFTQEINAFNIFNFYKNILNTKSKVR